MQPVGAIIAFVCFGIIYSVHATSPRRCAPCPHALINPVCGSDGRLYRDSCDLKYASCRSNNPITEIPWRKCKPKTCNVACTLEYTEMCGEDGKIYGGNRCTFLWRSCRRPTPLKEAPMSFCPDGNNWPPFIST